MKVCLVGPFPEKPSDVMGGVAQVISCLAYGLHSAGCDVHIVSVGKIQKTVMNRKEFTVHFVKRLKLPGIVAQPTIVRSRIHEAIKAINPDITHFHGFAGFTLFFDRPYVFTVHGLSERDVLYYGGPLTSLRARVVGALESYSRRNCQNVILISNYISSQLGAQISGRTWLIENPVDEGFFAIPRSPKKNALFIGLIRRGKNVMGLLEAFRLVRQNQPDAVLRLAGPEWDKRYASECNAFIEQCDLSESVAFLGGLQKADVRNELTTAGCLALLSHQEVAPVVVAEAMAAGVPVVASRVGGIPYMIEDGRTGFLVDAEDTQTAAERMQQLIRNEDVASRMGLAAKKVAAERFHIDKVTSKTIEVYESIISQ